MSISRNLESNDEESSIQEEGVSFPISRIVMCFKIYRLRHRPDGGSSHIVSTKLFKVNKL
jgi:hypothetical protein